MMSIRQSLVILGWPEGMSDGQIAEELLRRWFRASAFAPLKLSDPAVIARGVYSTLVRECGLDTLCWSTSEAAMDRRMPRAPVDQLMDAQQTKHLRADRDFSSVNRRKSDRAPRNELVDVMLDYGVNRAQGWLVDVSSDGVAFLLDAVNLPAIGQHIETVIHDRHGHSRPLGSGVIVRTEMLSNDLGLVCVELDEACEIVPD